MSRADALQEAMAHWLEATGAAAPLDLTLHHKWLRREHGYRGSLQPLQRDFKARFPTPNRRSRRRVETPPEAQCQGDWMHLPGVMIRDRTP